MTARPLTGNFRRNDLKSSPVSSPRRGPGLVWVCRFVVILCARLRAMNTACSERVMMMPPVVTSLPGLRLHGLRLTLLMWRQGLFHGYRVPAQADTVDSRVNKLLVV
jgi:hypothetical protein